MKAVRGLGCESCSRVSRAAYRKQIQEEQNNFILDFGRGTESRLPGMFRLLQSLETCNVDSMLQFVNRRISKEERRFS